MPYCLDMDKTLTNDAAARKIAKLTIALRAGGRKDLADALVAAALAALVAARAARAE